MKKWVKGIMGLAAAGGTIAGLVYYLKKKDSSEDDEFDDDFEDNDFDLDSDLKPVSDREYVSLNSAAKGGEDDETADEAKSEAEAEAETNAKDGTASNNDTAKSDTETNAD